tara:strand:+ start:22859 stop:23497 length:639 start_codon:yes stop_codon:yes gene_type:complete
MENVLRYKKLLSGYNEFIENYSDEKGYSLVEKFGENPRVFLLGMTHPNGIVRQRNSLGAFLEGYMQKGDMLLTEGRDAMEIIYDAYHVDDYISDIKDFLKVNNIRTTFNDNGELIGHALMSKQNIPIHLSDIVDEYESVIDTYMRCLDLRDINFSHGASTGIIPLIMNYSDNYRSLEDGARIFQVVGVFHIFNDLIQGELRKNSIDYAVYLP